jgi:hypothetical protein
MSPLSSGKRPPRRREIFTENFQMVMHKFRRREVASRAHVAKWWFFFNMERTLENLMDLLMGNAKKIACHCIFVFAPKTAHL